MYTFFPFFFFFFFSFDLCPFLFVLAWEGVFWLSLNSNFPTIQTYLPPFFSLNPFYSPISNWKDHSSTSLCSWAQPLNGIVRPPLPVCSVGKADYRCPFSLFSFLWTQAMFFMAFTLLIFSRSLTSVFCFLFPHRAAVHRSIVRFLVLSFPLLHKV